MPRGLRQILIAALAACHLAVLSAGPALHGWLGIDHERPASSATTSKAGGSPVGDLKGSADHCVVCHHLSLASDRADRDELLVATLIDRVPARPSVEIRPVDCPRGVSPRAPPLCA